MQQLFQGQWFRPWGNRRTSERPWQHCSADYKGPIGGTFYFLVYIDNCSRWLEIDVASSTSMDRRYKVLDILMGVLEGPETIMHGNGPPYNSRE